SIIRIGGFGLNDCSPMPVGTFPPNEFGLHEMLSNVNEWCHDCYAPYESTGAGTGAPFQRTSFRVIRGGSFSDDASKLRKSYRHGIHYKAKCMVDGFRVARNCLSKESLGRDLRV